jgi:hypothetical protein
MDAALAGNFQNFIAAVTSPSLRAIAHHWDQARGDRAMPAWADLSSSVLTPHFKMLWGFHRDSQTGEFTGRLAGRNVVDWLGANFWGASLKDIHPPHIFPESHSFLTRIVTAPAAGRSSGRLFSVGSRIVSGERIALPLGLDGITADGILGASDYDCPPLSGPVNLIHENIEWFAITA